MVHQSHFTNNMSIYIQSVSQISVQKPLTDEWFENPILPKEAFAQSIEPDYKQFIPPAESRRMGRLIKRAITTSLSALEKGGCEMPDAIISGTGLGCIENTEKFLNAVIDNDEECLPPTAFMQSTHNTISSQIAIRLHCHGYNSTYSNQGTSFDSALLDAFMQLQLGQVRTALVGGHDEMTPDYFNMLSKINYWRKEDVNVDVMRKCDKEINSFSGSCSLSMLVGTDHTENALCRLDGIEICHSPNPSQIRESVVRMLGNNNLNLSDVDAVVASYSGNPNVDHCVGHYLTQAMPEFPVIWYKHLFGESFCSSAFGMYVAAMCLYKRLIPKQLLYNQDDAEIKNPKHILVFNYFGWNASQRNVSLSLLSI